MCVTVIRIVIITIIVIIAIVITIITIITIINNNNNIAKLPEITFVYIGFHVYLTSGMRVDQTILSEALLAQQPFQLNIQGALNSSPL